MLVGLQVVSSKEGEGRRRRRENFLTSLLSASVKAQVRLLDSVERLTLKILDFKTKTKGSGLEVKARVNSKFRG